MPVAEHLEGVGPVRGAFGPPATSDQLSRGSVLRGVARGVLSQAVLCVGLNIRTLKDLTVICVDGYNVIRILESRPWRPRPPAG